MRKINSIVVHCSATRPNVEASVKTIDKWHKKRGWSGIGYHYVVRRNGQVEFGRPEERVGAHVRGHNRNSIGICLEGGLDKYGRPSPNYPKRQMRSLKGLLTELCAVHTDALIYGHRDFPDVNKACPCIDVHHWLLTGELRP